jgi:hypothetical protein
VTDEPDFGVRHFCSVAASPGDVENNNNTPRDILLRDRLRQRCAHRAQRAHTKRVERERRRNVLSSSDGEEMGVESDDEENEEDFELNDEVCLLCCNLLYSVPRGFGHLMHKCLCFLAVS